MQTTVVELGDVVHVAWLVEDAGAGVVGAAARTAVTIKRESDGFLYDFDDDTFKAVPTLPYANMVEDADLRGVYYYDLDTSACMTLVDVLTVHMVCASSPTDTEVVRIDVVKPSGYLSHGVVSHDYDSGITHMAALLLGDGGIETAADRAVFRIIKANDGTVLLNDQQVLVSVGGIFSWSQGSLGLEKHTAYVLVFSVELDSVSYRSAQPFTVL